MADNKKIETYKGFTLVQQFQGNGRTSLMAIFKDGARYSSIAVASKKAFIRIIDTYLKAKEK